MVYTCFACKWRGNKEPRRSFHKFPSEKDQKQKWLDIIGKSDAVLGTRTTLCSSHFEKSCFRYGLVCGKELLKEGSLPSLQLTANKDSDSREETKNDSVISNELDACGTPDTHIVPSLDKRCASKVIIERSDELIDVADEIPKQKLYVQSSLTKASTVNNSIDSTRCDYLGKQLREKKIEISSLRRQVRRLRKSTLSLKTVNKNLKSKLKRFQKEAHRKRNIRKIKTVKAIE